MAKDYALMTEQILASVGGAANVALATHCMTRLRLNLRDNSLADEDAIKQIPGVLGEQFSSGQLQVVVGQDVAQLYDVFCKEGGFQKSAAVDENLDEAPQKEKLTLKSAFDKATDYLAGSITPIIPVMIAAAMFKTLLVVLGPDMLGLFTAESDAYLTLDFLYDTFFYFMPIFIGCAAAKKLNVNEFYGLFLGAMLIVPDFVAMVGERESVGIYGLFPAAVASYGQTLLPIVLAVAIMAPIYRFLKDHIGGALSTIFVPFLTMFVMAPITLCVCGPIGSVVGGWIGNALIAFGSVGGALAVAVVGAVWQLLVLTGMHGILIVFAFTTLMSVGNDTFILVAGTAAAWAVFGTCIGAFLRIKDKEEKSQALSYFVAAFVGSVSEPALYGLCLKYKRPFAGLLAGGFAGGLYLGLTHVALYVPLPSNVMCLASFVAGGTGNLVNATIGCVIAMVVAAIVTFMVGVESKTAE